MKKKKGIEFNSARTAAETSTKKSGLADQKDMVLVPLMAQFSYFITKKICI